MNIVQNNPLEQLLSSSNKITRKLSISEWILKETDPEHGYSTNYLMQHAGYNALECDIYRLTYSYARTYAAESGLDIHIRNFIDTFDNSQFDEPIDMRDPDLVCYDLGSTILTLLITLSIDCNNIKQASALLNHDRDLRAVINALIPLSLPPHQDYSASSLYRMVTICAAGTEMSKDSSDAEMSQEPSEAEHHSVWEPMRLKSSITPTNRHEYRATHGFLNGQTIYSDKPFMDTLGGDGQEIRASYMDEEAGPGKHYVSVSIFNCTSRSLVDLILKNKKNHERAAFEEILSKFHRLIGFVFMADALNTDEHLFNFIYSKGMDLLMPVKANNGNKKAKQLIHQMFSIQGLEACESYKTFNSGVYVSGNRIERVTVETLSVSELQQLKESAPDQYLGLDLHALDAFDGVKTIVKKTKFTQIVGKRYSQKALDKLNKDNEGGEVRYYISTIENDDHGFKQILVSLNEYWLCEQAHNTADTVLEQDYISSGLKSNLALRVNLSRSAVDMLNLYKTRRNAGLKKSHQLSYASLRKVLSSNVSERLQCLAMFFSSMPMNCDLDQPQ